MHTWWLPPPGWRDIRYSEKNYTAKLSKDQWSTGNFGHFSSLNKYYTTWQKPKTCTHTHTILSLIELHMLLVETPLRECFPLNSHVSAKQDPHQTYTVSQEERSVFWKVTVSAILSKKKYACTCILFRTVSEIQLFQCTLYRRATRNVLTPAPKCTDVDGGIFENVLYYVLQRCLYLVVVVRFVRLCDPESNAGGNLSTSRATHGGTAKE
jgi:hypothetical protein